MSMHFLHGSVNEVYRTVINDLPSDWSKLIPANTETLLSYGLYGDPDHYSLVPLKTSDGTKLLFSRCSRKRQAKAPSYFVHKQILDASMDTLYSNFEALLRTPFCSEAEFDYVAKNKALQPRPDVRWTGKKVPIAPEVLRGILYALIGRWRSGGEPVFVGVPPMSSEAYTDYTLGAVCEIYSCLPAALRGQVGFMTYTTPSNTLKSVGLFFLPEQEASGYICLDRENETSRQLLNRYLPESLKELIDRIVDHPTQRQKELKQLWEMVESQTTPGDIREGHYTSFLKYSPLLKQEVTDQTHFDQLSDFFRNLDTVPEPLRGKLLAPLQSKVTTRILDTYLLNRKPEDTSFREYLTRIETEENLCASTESLQNHTRQKISEVFTAFLNNLNQTEELGEMDALLTELQNNPSALCRPDLVNTWADNWTRWAKPIYQKWVSGKLDELISDLKEIAEKKAPDGASLETIRTAEPLDVVSKFLSLKNNMIALLKDLPARVNTDEIYRKAHKDTIRKEVQLQIAHLLKQYKDAAERDMNSELDTIDSSLTVRIASCRNTLDELLQDILKDEPEQSSAILSNFDQAVIKASGGKLDNLIEEARCALDVPKDTEAAELYTQIQDAKRDLLQKAADLSLDQARLDPFFQKLEEQLVRHVQNLCSVADADLYDEQARKAEEQRLKKLKKFIGQKYPKNSALKNLVTQSLKTVDDAGKGANKRRRKESDRKSVEPPLPKLDIDSLLENVPDQTDTASSEQEDSASQEQENNFYIPHSSNAPATAPQERRISVSQASLESIYGALAMLPQNSQYATLYCVIRCTEQPQTYSRQNLQATLGRFLNKPEGECCLSDEEMITLLDQLSTATITKEERIHILETLAEDNASADVGQKCMCCMIHAPKQWHCKDQEQRILAILQEKPEYAENFPAWKRKLKTKREVSIGQKTTFWLGFSAGVLSAVFVMVLCLALYAFFILLASPEPVAPTDPEVVITESVPEESVPEETTIPEDDTRASAPIEVYIGHKAERLYLGDEPVDEPTEEETLPVIPVG